MYSFQLSNHFLTESEKAVFHRYLELNGLDATIWPVFSSLFQTGIKNSRPLMLRIFEQNDIAGAIILIHCKKYGKALFSNKLMAAVMDMANIQMLLWIKFGCCMDMMSNPGFVKEPAKKDKIFKAAVAYLKNNRLLTVINDYSENSDFYEGAAKLPALLQSFVDCSEMTSIADYTGRFKNIKKKLNTFRKKGGEFIKVENCLNDEQTEGLKKCFTSTAEKSVIYLPYQDLYLNAAIHTSKTPAQNVIYFVATLNGEFLGYQAVVVTGKNLNCLHGAFNRSYKTTYHAYDILFVKMVEYAIENNLETIDWGPVANLTKQKMVTDTKVLTYYLYSKYGWLQKMLRIFLMTTKLQGKAQMQFRKTTES